MINRKYMTHFNAEPVQLSATGPTDEVTYVHPKQYERILIRRIQRRRLEEQGKIPSNGERKVCVNTFLSLFRRMYESLSQ